MAFNKLIWKNSINEQNASFKNGQNILCFVDGWFKALRTDRYDCSNESTHLKPVLLFDCLNLTHSVKSWYSARKTVNFPSLHLVICSAMISMHLLFYLHDSSLQNKYILHSLQLFVGFYLSLCICISKASLGY